MFKTFLEERRHIITEGNPNNGICFDGAVNPKIYEKKNPRLLIFLKETNGNNNDGTAATELTDWDYMSWVRDQAAQEKDLYRSVYRNIAMWARQFDLYASGYHPQASDLMDSNGLVINKELCDALNGIAIINLKKSWGCEQTNWSDMNRYLEEVPQRKEILLHQVEVLAPDLVLCGGTFDFVHGIFGNGIPVQTTACKDGQRIDFFQTASTMFASCYHPSKPGWAREKSFEHANNIFDLFFSMY